MKKGVIMDLLELLKKRYSVRKFDGRKVEKEKLDLILEAGRVAPTAVNFQPQRVLVIESEEALEKLKSCTPYHFNAPLALLICFDKNVSWKRSHDNYEMGAVDASIVTTQMMLEVENLGLGTTWVGSFKTELLRTSFNIPENYEPVAILPVGYPAQDSVPNPHHNERYELNHTVFYNSF